MILLTTMLTIYNYLFTINLPQKKEKNYSFKTLFIIIKIYAMLKSKK